jgi:hypothetical protein
VIPEEETDELGREEPSGGASVNSVQTRDVNMPTFTVSHGILSGERESVADVRKDIPVTLKDQNVMGVM